MAQNYLVGCIPIPRVYKDDVQAFMCDLVDSTDDMMLSNEEDTRQIYDTNMEGRTKAAAKKKSDNKATAAAATDSAGREKMAQTMPVKLLRAKFALELRTKEEEEGEEEGTRPRKKAKRSSSKNEIGDSSNSEEEVEKEASNPDTIASNSVAEQMVDALAGFQFPLGTKAAIKSAALVFLDMVRRFHLNVSEDDKEARRSIGPFIFSNRKMDLSFLEFCSIVCDLFGFNKSGQQVEEQRKVVRSMCQCVNNATFGDNKSGQQVEKQRKQTLEEKRDAHENSAAAINTL